MRVTIKKIQETLGYTFAVCLGDNGLFQVTTKMMKDKVFQGVTEDRAHAGLQSKLFAEFTGVSDKFTTENKGLEMSVVLEKLKILLL